MAVVTGIWYMGLVEEIPDIVDGDRMKVRSRVIISSGFQSGER